MERNGSLLNKPRHRLGQKRLLPGLLAALLMSSTGLAAQEDDPKAQAARLKAIEQELAQRSARQEELAAKARAAGREAEALSRRLVAAAADMQAVEARVADLEARVDEVVGDIAEQEEALAVRRAEMVETLAALQRLSQRPPATTIFRPAEAVDTVRTAGLLSSLVPKLRTQANQIGDAVETLRLTRVSLELDRKSLDRELGELAVQTDRLESLLSEREAERRSNEKQARKEEERIARLVNEAKSLKDLIDALDADRARAAADAAERLATIEKPDVPQTTSMASAQGALPMPAQGTIVRRFGEIEGAGHARGIRIRTRGAAPVVAPFDGRVVFAGPFRTYGEILIISHGDGYHSLLAGLDRVSTQVGQWVLAGEPVGRMATGGTVAAGGSSAAPDPELYVEIRQGGEPINPLSWLAAGNRKVG